MKKPKMDSVSEDWINRKAFILGALGLFSSVNAGCATGFAKFNYRLALTVQAYGGQHSGSSVVGVRPYMSQGLGGRMIGAAIKGEATAVDCGDGRYVFALLRGLYGVKDDKGRMRYWHDDPTVLLQTLYGVPLDFDGYEASMSALATKRGAFTFDLYQLPTLATFGNIVDPKTVVVADPDGPIFSDDESSRVVSAEIQTIDAPINRDLRRILPWLDENRPGAYVSGSLACSPDIPSECLQMKDFVRG